MSFYGGSLLPQSFNKMNPYDFMQDPYYMYFQSFKIKWYTYIIDFWKVKSMEFKSSKSSKILQGALFWKNSALLETGYFHLFKWGKITTWQGCKCWIWKINEKAWCILKIRACIQTCTGGFLEDSGSFLARIPQGVRVLILIHVLWKKIYMNLHVLAVKSIMVSDICDFWKFHIRLNTKS